MSFETLPDQLIMCTFEYLSWQDYLNIQLVCKKFVTTISNHQKFWARECIRTYFLTNLDYLSEFYESPQYVEHLKSKVDKFQGKNWKKLLVKANATKSKMRNTIKGFAAVSDAVGFVNCFYEQLRNPSLPSLPMKRETIICTTRTMFQEHLCGVLYEDFSSPNDDFMDDEEYGAAMDSLAAQKQDFIAEIEHRQEKNLLMQARWYHKTQTQNQNTLEIPLPNLSKVHSTDKSIIWELVPDYSLSKQNSQEIIIPSESPLLALYSAIHDAVSNYCAIVFEYLSGLDNVYDLVSEYTARWTAFTYSILLLNITCSKFVEAMNDAYEQLFVGYPSYPKFSMWRLMVKIWMHEVYDNCKLSKALNESFLRITHNHREKLIKEAINNNFSCVIKSQNYEDLYEVPKKLFLSVNTKKHKSMVANYNFTTKKIENTPHSYFSNDTEAERRLLYSFLQSINDISLNEVNIHYVDCTDLATSYPFAELEQAFLEQSCSFYEDQSKIFEESPNFFCQFLRSDISFLTDILTPRTSIKLERIQVEHGYSFLQQSVAKLICSLDSDALEKIEVPPHLANYNNEKLRLFLLDIQGRMISEYDDQYTKAQDNKLVQKWITAIESQVNRNFRSNFEFLDEQQKTFEDLVQKDHDVRNFNIKKNIPCQMGDIDCLFYDLDKSIEPYFIEKLYQDSQPNHENKSNDPFSVPELEEEEFDLPELSISNAHKSSIYANIGEVPIDFDDIESLAIPDAVGLALSK